MPAKKAELDPGDQGPAGTGVQGMGTNTPNAAAVAAATAGFARLIHTPKGGMFRNGIISTIFPICVGPLTTGGGIKLSVDGAAPMAHMATAPVATAGPGILPL